MEQGVTQQFGHGDDMAEALRIVTTQIAAAPSTQPRFAAQSALSALSRAGFELHRRGVSIDWPDDYLTDAERARKAESHG